ncbi:Ubiquinone/menaquinone biosynthesis C-methyltransferase UbiE [Pseudovibrio sp. W64]|uniref:methionine biosynthesis protein MetW n=1 Tax=unclassified Pseudovibrio TaxID=2627060 RepID=UPI0007AE5231|nr:MULTISPECIES: methionine biosynthesis protein MetW [unclassified Pseudovibrio]KZK84012.1 Ubiquinone/menaquinone biosynthesis C-methyltransferase UbiE [Pseudovibrio sp. W64]KZK88197.1 Ubiquinone/menaquinone biosynthesis C-methyltransferase UbiE [Pseudovibrio sp. Ad13]KZK96295.1 Ubiquinone/menaquinone biosynthesis C-methyltransferase UbiE [Pseudovibrio sp. Ad46]KZK99716.1 Ubiquinone/menaquinone biosynthesis C-methyltransferase UbiE [Pseudovibrio sp. W74]KZL00892.1 Ubiquinone/menaquinone biosy
MTKHDLSNVRGDHRILCDFVASGSRVLDIGCGTGELLELLIDTRGVDGRGFDTSQKGVNEAVARGLSVVQGDADNDLAAYPDDAFDYAILSHTLQATMDPKQVLEQLLRIGKKVVVSFPNFGHWRNRMQLLFKGRMPVTDYLPYEWYDTPNIHFCTIRDFVALSEEVHAKVIKAEALDARGQRIGFNAPWWVWNLIGDQAVFLLERK